MDETEQLKTHVTKRVMRYTKTAGQYRTPPFMNPQEASAKYCELLKNNTPDEAIKILGLENIKGAGRIFAPDGFKHPPPYRKPSPNTCYGTSSLANVNFNREKFLKILAERGITVPEDIDNGSLEAWLYQLPPSEGAERMAEISRQRWRKELEAYENNQRIY